MKQSRNFKISSRKRKTERPQAWLAHAYALAGKARAAKDIARELASGHPALASSIALVYAGLGEVEPAIQWFQKSYEQRALFSFRFSSTLLATSSVPNLHL